MKKTCVVTGAAGGIGKEVVRKFVNEGYRVVLIDLVQIRLEQTITELGYQHFYLEGNTKVSLRNEYVKRFNSGERDVFLISLKAGGTGLNLTGADTVIHFDPWWNSAVEDQASDRAHRIGQEKNVHVIKLLTKGTIEEKIFRLQQKKQDLFNAVIEAGETFLNKLTEEEIRELFADPEA